MAHVRRLAFLCAFATSVACRSKPPEDPELAASGPVTRELTLDELAARIDPGAQAPISDGLSPRIFGILGLEASPTDSGRVLLERSEAEYAEFERGMKGAEELSTMVVAIRAAARSLVLAEQAARRGADEAEVLARLELAYRVADVPTLASDQSTLARLLRIFADSAEGQEVGDPEAQREPLGEVVQGAIRAAGPLHRRAVAQLLRAAPEHSAVPTAILAVATAARGEGLDWTIPAAKLALERRGPSSSADERIDLARVCFAGLDLECGEAALRSAVAGAGFDEVEESYDEAKGDAALARRIVALRGASTLEDRLERARKTLRLGRHGAARAEFEALHADFPEDARPVGGLALHAVETEFDFGRAHRLIDAQESSRNGDAEYYEIAIGTRLMAVMGSVVPSLLFAEGREVATSLRPLIRRMRADIDAYAALGSTDARYLGLLLDVGEEMLDRYTETGSVSLRDVTSLSDRALGLQASLPDNPHAYRLVMAVSMLEADRARAAKMAALPPPVGVDREAMTLRRARALADLAVLWSDLSFADQALEALEGVDPASSSEAAELHADALMVQRLLGGAATWTRVGEAYEPLVDEHMTPGDARALNNIALAVMNNDGVEVARLAWTLSSELAEDHGDVPRLNLIVSGSPEGGPAALAEMSALAEETTNAGVRVTALAWVHAWSKGRARRDATVALDRAVRSAFDEGLRPAPPDPYAGLVLEGSMKAGFGYEIASGLRIELDGAGLPWGILAPPRRG